MNLVRRFPLLLVLSAGCCARAEAQSPRVDLPRVLAELEPEIRARMTDGRIPSLTVALVAGDSIVWTGAYGYANLRTRTLATVETVYLIGSTFKAISTVALLQQVERGNSPGS